MNTELIEETKRKMAVMAAFANEKQIQVKERYPNGQWEDTDEPAWNWRHYDYRVKPEPRVPRVRWINEYPEDVNQFEHLGVSSYATEQDAIEGASPSAIKQIKLMEVIE